MTLNNPVFKVTLFFAAEYLINGERYGQLQQKANRKQNPIFRMVPVWMTLVIYNPDFMVTIIQRQITRK